MSTAKRKSIKAGENKRILQHLVPMLLIMVSILGTFIVARIVAYLVLVTKTLPRSLFVQIGDFRLHHFVYGNIVIIVTGFLAIGLGIRKHKNLFAIAYGIGLGMVLDEFMLWVGDPVQLVSNTIWIPHSTTVISIVLLLIASIIMFDLYELKRSSSIRK